MNKKILYCCLFVFIIVVLGFFVWRSFYADIATPFINPQKLLLWWPRSARALK